MFTPNHDKLHLSVNHFQEVSPQPESDMLYAILKVGKASFFVPIYGRCKT